MLDDGQRAVGVQQRITVGLGFGHKGVADHAAGPRLVFHHHGLPQCSAELFGIDARGYVRVTACCIGDDQRDGFGFGPALGRCRGAQQASGQAYAKGLQSSSFFHGFAFVSLLAWG